MSTEHQEALLALASTDHQKALLANSRRKHLLNMVLLTLWTFGVGTASWIGGAAQEKIFYLEATNTALITLRNQDLAAYGIIDRAKAEKVAICVALKGKNCDETLE